MRFDKFRYLLNNFRFKESPYSDISPGYFPSYSQEGEDMILREIFEDRRNGFYVDIGAYDPIRFSNTNYFYQNGWTGINIEPSPDAIKKFTRHRKKDINVNAGVSKKEDTLQYYSFDEAALNTFDLKRIEYLEQTSPYRHKAVFDIPVFTLKSILSKYCSNKIINFMNIDVEWHEMEVLESNDWDRFRPEILLVEILDFDIDYLSNSKVHNYLKNLGYKFECKTPRTCFYKDLKR